MFESELIQFIYNQSIDVMATIEVMTMLLSVFLVITRYALIFLLLF